MSENALDMTTAKAFYNPSIQGAGKRFEERTEIFSISAQEVSFRLNARLLIGAKMTVTLDVPRTLILESPLRLLVTGLVVHVRSESQNGKCQFVSLRLDRTFRLKPSPPAPAV
jgi:hypothetical protein